MIDWLIDMTDEARRIVEDIAAMFEPFDNPLIEYRPHGDREVNAVYGDPTRGGLYLKKPDPVWKKRNIVYCGPKGHLPPIHPKLARYWWACHRNAEPTFRELLRRVEIVAPGHITEDGGTWAYNHRRIGHDTPEKAAARKAKALAAGKKVWVGLKPLSRHAWGCAIDLEPKRNRRPKKPFKPGKTPLLWSKEWMAIWPDGITPAIYGVMLAMRLRCGIEWKGSPDPMHGEGCGSNVQM